MLEAFPALTSFLMALTYLQWKKGQANGYEWLARAFRPLSGLTAASKYLYCVVGIAILVDWYLDLKEERDHLSVPSQRGDLGIAGICYLLRC